MFAAMIESSPLGELEGASSFVQLATPKAPARAVSTVITIFKMVFQSVFIGFEFLSLVLVIGVC